MSFEGDLVQQQQSQVIASYNWVEIASGTGMVTFYPFTAKETTNTTYHLTTDSTQYSEDKTISTTVSGALAKQADLDFDSSPLKVKRIFGGDGTILLRFSAADAVTISGYIIVKVRKYSGTTETDIGTATSKTIAYGESFTTTIPITITETAFSVGDVIRITVEVWGSASTAGTITFACDPANRSGTAEAPGYLEVKIPSRIDL